MTFAAIGGLAGSAGGAAVGGGLLGFGQSALQHAYNEDLQWKQMQFQALMSNTAYRRAMADMHKAGLNPMLVSGLGGASTPPGAAAQVGMPDIAGSATRAFSARQQQRLQKLQEGVAKAERARIHAARDDALYSSTEHEARTDLIYWQGAVAQKEAKMYIDFLDSPQGKTWWYTQKALEVLPGLGSATSAYKAWRGVAPRGGK